MISDMSDNVVMSVSAIVPVNGKKAAFVHFSDKDKEAEFVLPECRQVSSAGFTEEELKQLLAYVTREKDTLMDMAKRVDPLGRFMKERV